MSEALTASVVVRAIGFALIDFLWQGAAIGVVTAVLLKCFGRARPQVRYVIGCAGLAAMAVAPALTAVGHLRDHPQSSLATIGIQLAIGDSQQLLTADAVAASGAGSAILSAAWLERRLPLVVLLWTAGVLLLALHLLYGWLRVRHIRTRSWVYAMDRWPEAVLHAARRFGSPQRVRLLVSSLVDVPAVIGVLRPAIVVPASALAGLPPAHLEAILIHELAHIRRGDYLVNVVQCVVEVLLFYHPAVWWVSGQIRREREHCCDDVAAALCADRIAYARALTSLEELRIRTPLPAVGADGGELLHRIRRLIAPHSVTEPRVSGGFAMGVIFTIALVALNAHFGSLPAAAEPAEDQRQPAQAVSPVPAVMEVIEVVPEPPATPRRPRPAGRTQVVTTGLSGVVRDQTGGVIPGATVTVSLSPETTARTAITNARGEFVFADLKEGSYQLTVSLPGFRTTRGSIHLASGQTSSVVVRLDVGHLAETVTVSSPSTPARPAQPAARQVPANPQTPSEYFDAAKILYEQGRSDEAVVMTRGALELLRSAMPEIPIEVNPEAVQSADRALNPSAPIRVGGSIMEPRKIRHVSPVYPPDAAAAGIVGVVVLEAVIARDGSVKDLTVLTSVPVFEEAALAAVRQWRFTPTLLNGMPVEVAMTVTINFARQ